MYVYTPSERDHNALDKRNECALSHLPRKIAEHDWPEGTLPAVSIVCVTYNHKNYIGDCLDSILKQETNYPVEIIVNDDASTDGTTEIVQRYAREYPGTIRPFIRTENQFSKGMSSTALVLPECRGGYVAFCEGDDTWLGTTKLQTQFDFLESNAEYSLCFHDALIINEHGQTTGLFSRGRLAIENRPTGPIGIEEMLVSPRRACHINTVFVRKETIPATLQTWMNNFPVYDYPLIATFLAGGRNYYINSTSSTYRKHSNSVTAKRPHDFRYFLRLNRMLKMLQTHLNPQYRRSLQKKRLSYAHEMLLYYADRNMAIFVILLAPLLLLSQSSPLTIKDHFWMLKNKLKGTLQSHA